MSDRDDLEYDAIMKRIKDAWKSQSEGSNPGYGMVQEAFARRDLGNLQASRQRFEDAYFAYYHGALYVLNAGLKYWFSIGAEEWKVVNAFLAFSESFQSRELLAQGNRSEILRKIGEYRENSSR